MFRVALIALFAVLLSGCSSHYQSSRVDNTSTNHGAVYHADHQNSTQQKPQYNYIQRYSYRFPNRTLTRNPRTFRTRR